jgi:hypothetical protein
MRLRPGVRPKEKRRKSPKTKDWQNCLAKLKNESFVSNFTYCEFQFPGCEGRLNLGYSHPQKRRHTKTGDLSICVLSCGKCHRFVENHEQKLEFHEKARNSRLDRYWQAV